MGNVVLPLSAYTYGYETHPDSEFKSYSVPGRINQKEITPTY